MNNIYVIIIINTDVDLTKNCDGIVMGDWRW